jgi:hypothetical protein
LDKSSRRNERRGRGEAVFKFIPTLHVYVLRAGIKRGEDN